MRERVEGVSHVVLVASGKGGVGKTTVTINLALALASDGARVGVFDADVHGPDVPLMLGIAGIPPEQSRKLTLALGRRDTEPYIPPLDRFGVRFMSVGLLVAESDVVRASAVGLLAVQTMRDVIWGELDYLLVDTPPGTLEPQQTIARTVELDGVVLVTTPQDLSLLDTGRSLLAFEQEGVRVLGVVENMSGMTCPHCGEPIEVFQRTEREWVLDGRRVEVLGRLPLSPSIGGRITRSSPVLDTASSSPEAGVFRELARALRERTADSP